MILSNGQIADGRLSDNVMLLDAEQTVTGIKHFGDGILQPNDITNASGIAIYLDGNVEIDATSGTNKF